jgi:hypothetical protein
MRQRTKRFARIWRPSPDYKLLGCHVALVEHMGTVLRNKNFVVPLILLIGTSASCSMHKFPRFTNEDIHVVNYLEAPLELVILRKWVKAGVSKEWVDTCFEYTIRNNSENTIDSYSYDIGPEGNTPYVMGKAFVVPKPGQSATAEKCVANKTRLNEGHFLFRLSFVERNGKTLWESDAYRRRMNELNSLPELQRR